MNSERVQKIRNEKRERSISRERQNTIKETDQRQRKTKLRHIEREINKDRET